MADADIVAQLIETRDGYLAALLADSVKPRLDYSIDGQAVSRASWRSSMFKAIADTNNLINMFQPFEIMSQVIN